MESIKIAPPEAWLLLDNRQSTKRVLDALEDAEDIITDATRGVLYNPKNGAQCEIVVFRLNEDSIRKSDLPYSFFFDILASEESLRGLILGDTGEVVAVSGLEMTQERLGDTHMAREYRWVISNSHSSQLGFGEVDMVGPVARMSICFWQPGVERGDEQAVLYATRDAVQVSLVAPETDS